MTVRIILTGVLLVSLVALQWHFAGRKVTELDPKRFGAMATVLHESGDWRYGYVRDSHGAILVRTDASTEVAQSYPGDEIPELTELMRSELRAIPWKSVGEALLYSLVLGLLLWALPSAYGRAFVPRLPSALIWYGVGWMLILAVLLLPMWVVGYGPPLYSTWEGPGAFSWSGPYYEVSGTSGLTVSYRPVVEVVFRWPVQWADAAGLSARLPEVQWPTYLWIAAAPVYGLMGAAVGGLKVWKSKRTHHQPVATVSSVDG